MVLDICITMIWCVKLPLRSYLVSVSLRWCIKPSLRSRYYFIPVSLHMVCQTPSQIKVLLDICFNSYSVSNSLSD
uniref:Uncharacterized protein n=1 Tax=Aegilops tauschii subsp. strangulata TaxID=200361 RepID=A0A453CKK4_AEGTS